VPSGDRSLARDLLIHLEKRHFIGAPRYLGIDDKGREILTYLPGDVPVDLANFDDRRISAAAALLRRFHDATMDFPLVREQDAEVMCHNDFGPPNTVFRHGLPCAMIDFDTLAPGERLWDTGYSAFMWLDLGNPDYTGEEQARRLGVFAGGYGSRHGAAAQIATFALARQTDLAASAEAGCQQALWADACASWTRDNLAGLLLPDGSSVYR
jgi:aminoglycoside phosphotransferase (APT) family kinase protein